MLAAEHQVKRVKHFLDIVMKSHVRYSNTKQYLSVKLPSSTPRVFLRFPFQRVKEQEEENEILRHQIQALEASAVSSTQY